MAKVDTPHLKWPLRFEGDHMAVVEQDSIEEIEQCVEAIVRYPLGFRDELPEFGLSDQTFLQGGVNVEVVRAVIERWEPRVDLTISSDFDLDTFESLVLTELRRRNISG